MKSTLITLIIACVSALAAYAQKDIPAGQRYEAVEGIQIARGTTTAKAFLNGRTLSFTGIKSTATAEVLNSLGQVVARGAIDGAASTLNLAHLDAGIYMVRVTGKSVNFTNKIVVR